MEEVDVLVVGAGLAGLSCARTLVEAGKRVVVLERSSAVGGRCASKPVSGAPTLDFGPVFVHGDDPEFLTWVESLGADLMAWPSIIEGKGTPCQPQAFDPLQKQWALKGGLRSLADDLARGTSVVRALVETLAWTAGGIEAIASDGRRFRGRDVVLTLALEQTLALLATLPQNPGEPWRSAQALLSQFTSLPCLTVLAEYEASVVPPAWHVLYPEGNSSLLLVSHETSKRAPLVGGGPCLVIQARPGWSSSRLEGDRDAWARQLLDDAAMLVGAWVAHPRALVAHRWKYARLGGADHLVRPLVLSRKGWPGRLGMAGDLFDLDGGLQGAWRSGRQLAQLLLE